MLTFIISAFGEPSRPVRKQLRFEATTPKELTESLPMINTPTPGDSPEFKGDSWIDDTPDQPALHCPPEETPTCGCKQDSNEQEMLYLEITNLRQERDEARARVLELEQILKQRSLCSEAVTDNDNQTKMLTGIIWARFLQMVTYLSVFVPCNSNQKDSLSFQEQIFLTLVRLRHNVSFDLLAFIIGIPRTTCIDYFGAPLI